MTTILIVDDHKHLAESLATTIPWDTHGVDEVRQAYSGMEAVETFEREPIDILITDIRMPVMSGIELIRIVRARYPQTDCILLTGHAEFEYARQAIELETAHYLLKPVKHDELVDAVTKLIGRRRLRSATDAETVRLKSDLVAAKAELELSAERERTRIAHDLHDIVGYTLTSSMIQLEAAKRQLASDRREEGLQRLQQSHDLMRRSLGQIREIFRIVPSVEPEGDLRTVLERFLQNAESAANIRVDRSFGLPEPVNDADRIKTLLHAALEGITNGIRHGNAAFFRFRLDGSDGELRFSLWNDGSPYGDGPSDGVGLKAMRERAARLGGYVRLSATKDPDGTMLTVTLPYDDR